MTNKNLKTFLFIVTSLFSLNAFAASWNADTHALVAGDFDNDGQDDMLYVAKDPASKSGIVLSDENGDLNILHQEWDSNHLGLTWHSGTYTPHVGDFNGDGHADIFLDHKTTGTNYTFHTNLFGKIESTTQRTSISNTTLGLNWGSSRLVFGDFNGDGSDDVYLQPKDAQTSSRVVFADSLGKFTAIGDTWSNVHLGFQWSQNDAVVYAGDFDGNGQDDLLIQAKPDWVMIPYSDLIIPVQRFEDQANGIVIANTLGKFSAGASLDFWSSEFLNINWSPDKYQIIVGDYNNDGRDDIFLQALQAGQESFILLSGTGGQFSNLTQVSQTLNSSYSAAVYKATAGDFNGDGSSELYLQAVSTSGSNYVATVNATNVSKKLHDASKVINVVESPAGTAVGKLPGQFSVDPSGGANYNIPIAVAPGVAGMQPELSLAYNSRSGNSQFGVGWSLTGLSAITRCPKTIAQDGVKTNENYTVDYSINDRFCLDGQRLNLEDTTQTYGSANSEYRTEIETFQKVTALGQVAIATAPDTFKVIDKTGMTRYYGDKSLGENSRVDVEISGITTRIRAWYISRIEDRFGNYIKYVYDQVEGEHLLKSIEYFNASNAAIGKVSVVYDASRPDQTTGYTMGGEVASLKHRAKQLDVYSIVSEGGGLGILRSYFINYQQGFINNQSYVYSVQQCDGNDRTKASCLPATTFNWDHGSYGYTGVINYDQNIDSGSSVLDFHILDLFGDGSANDVIAQGKIVSATSGGIEGMIETLLANPWDIKHSVVLDYDGDGRQDVLMGNPTNGQWDLLTSKTGTVTEIQEGLASGFDAGNATAVDLTQDGLPDVLFSSGGKLKLLINSPTGFISPAKNLNLAINKHQRIIPIEYDGDGVPEIYITTDECTSNSTNGQQILPDGWVRIYPTGGVISIPYYLHTPTGETSLFAPDGTVTTYVVGSSSTTSCIDTSGVLDWNGEKMVVKTLHGSDADDMRFMDINGDGLTDQILYSETSDRLIPLINIGRNAGGYFNSHFQSTIDVYSTGIGNQGAFKRGVVHDHNRDGKADFMVHFDGGGGHWKVWESNGVDGFKTHRVVSSNSEIQHTSDSSGIRFQDWTGDGILDYIYIRDLGSSFGEPDGDWRLRVVNGIGRNSGKLTKITDGLGNYVELKFKPLTDGTVYTGHEGTSGNANNNSQVTVGYPIANMMAPMDVVSSYAVSTGNGGNLTTTHKYGGAKVSLDGRGFLGFWRNTAYNSNTNTTTVNFNSQKFPFTGSVRESTQLTILDNVVDEVSEIDICDIDPVLCDFNLDGQQLPKTINKTSTSTTTTTSSKQTYSGTASSSITPETLLKITTLTEFAQLTSSGGQIFPYVDKSTETHQNAESGGIFKRIVTQNNYDNWGCADDITVDVDDGSGGDLHRIFTDNTFSTANTEKWILCRLTDVKVDHTRAASPHVLGANAEPLTERRHSSFTYNPITGVIETETIEPTANADKPHTVTKSYHYDAHGNRDIETISFQDVNIDGTPQQATRSISTVFDSIGLYPKSLTNAKGHTEYYDWNYLYGTRVKTTDSNGLSTEAHYNTFGQAIKGISTRRAKYATTEYLWCQTSNINPFINTYGSSIVCISPLAVYAVQTSDSAVSANGGVTSITEFDQLGREVHVRSLTFDKVKAEGNTYTHRQTRYDVLGRAYAASLPYFANNPICWVLKDYDMVGRTVREGVPKGDGGGVCDTSGNPPASWSAGNYDVSSYQYNGLTTASVDPNGRSALKVNNVIGRLLLVSEDEVAVSVDGVFSTTVLDNIETYYDYDALGNLTYVRDDAGNETRMGYDLRGNKTSMNDPDMGEWSYEYNALRQLVYQKDAEKTAAVGPGVHEVRMAYDELGRMVQRVEAEGPTTWEYDTQAMGIGKLAKVTASNVTKEYIYSSDYGELAQVTEIIDGEYYATSTGYDTYGRAYYTQYPSLDTSNSSTGYLDPSKRYRVRQFYNANGFASNIKEWNSNGSYGATLWEADAVDAQGNVTQSTLGNGVVETKGFNEVNGALLSNDAWHGTDSIIQQNYTWDATGNLRSRTDHLVLDPLGTTKVGRHEKFTYDSLYRLKTSTLHNGTSSAAAVLKTDSHSYDSIGNLLNKGAAYQSYNYNGATGGPHAVSSINVSGEAEARSYHYDNNGNLTSITGGVVKSRKTVEWTSFNKTKVITRGLGNSSEFWYGPDRARYKQVAMTDSADLDPDSAIPNYNKVTTTYIGGLYERQIHENTVNATSNTEHHHYVNMGGSVIAIAKRFNADVSVTQLNYLHRDHIGSVIAITDSLAQVLETMSYDAWGKKRNSASFSDYSPASFVTSILTKRGYTGHEMLDNVGLVNMNGRVYDAEIGRFLSADIFIQFPESTQGFNRYTYVNNNPLSFSDPSGFSLWTDFRDSVIQITIRTVLNYFVPGLGDFYAVVQGYNSAGGDLGLFAINIAISSIPGGDTLTQKVLVAGLKAGLRSEIYGTNFGDEFTSEVANIAAQAVVDRIIEIFDQTDETSSSDTDESSTGGVDDSAESRQGNAPAADEASSEDSGDGVITTVGMEVRVGDIDTIRGDSGTKDIISLLKKLKASSKLEGVEYDQIDAWIAAVKVREFELRFKVNFVYWTMDEILAGQMKHRQSGFEPLIYGMGAVMAAPLVVEVGVMSYPFIAEGASGASGYVIRFVDKTGNAAIHTCITIAVCANIYSAAAGSGGYITLVLVPRAQHQIRIAQDKLRKINDLYKSLIN